MDGGMRTNANADLAHGYERVVIVAPVAAGIGFMASPRRQGGRPDRSPSCIALVRPDRAAVRAIGRNVLDVSRRAAAAAGRAPGCGGSPGRPGRLAGLTPASHGRPDDDSGDPRPALEGFDDGSRHDRVKFDAMGRYGWRMLVQAAIPAWRVRSSMAVR
jgi:hypothetical protein